MPVDKSVRVRAILGELDDAAKEYDDVKRQFEMSRVRFEVARERFAKTKELASVMMGHRDWFEWQSIHPNVKYAGSPLGDTIVGILYSNAWETAEIFVEKKSPGYQPSLSLESIARILEEGGYEFKSIAPMRETNAALMKLKGVMKNSIGWYQVDNADGILEELKKFAESDTED